MSPTKEDVEHHVPISTISKPTPLSTLLPNSSSSSGDTEEDRLVTLSPNESQMFKTMTRSLTIPHFLYTHNVEITTLNRLRKKFNDKANSRSVNPSPKLSLLPFIMKAVSQAFTQFPKLNSHLNNTTDCTKSQLLLKAGKHFGVAVDTPQGLLVPVVRDVQSRSLVSIAVEIKRLSSLAQEGRLAPDDFKGATFTISNIGSIGGSAVSPVIVAPMVGILAVGRVEDVPIWQADEHGGEKIVRGERIVLSWSADHRVVDGATLARAAEVVGTLLRDVESF